MATRREDVHLRERIVSLVGALVVTVAGLGLMICMAMGPGIKLPEPAQVDLVPEFPAETHAQKEATETKAVPATPVPKAPPKEVRKVAEKAQPKPVAKAKPEPKPVKPDIALKRLEERTQKEENLQKLMREKEQQQKREEVWRTAEAKEAREAQLAKEAEGRERAIEQRVAEMEKAARKARAGRDLDLQKYLRAIREKVQQKLVEPPGLSGNPQALFEVHTNPQGDVLEKELKLIQSSGVPAYDEAARKAILAASPLFSPDWDPIVVNELRPLRLYVRRRE